MSSAEQQTLVAELCNAVKYLHRPAAIHLAQHLIVGQSIADLRHLLGLPDPTEAAHACARSDAHTNGLRGAWKQCLREPARQNLLRKIEVAKTEYAVELRAENRRDVRISWRGNCGYEPCWWPDYDDWVILAQLWERRYDEDAWDSQTRKGVFHVVLLKQELETLRDAVVGMPVEIDENVPLCAMHQLESTPLDSIDTSQNPLAPNLQSGLADRQVLSPSVSGPQSECSDGERELVLIDSKPVPIKGRSSSHWYPFRSAIETIATGHYSNNDSYNRIKDIWRQHDRICDRDVFISRYLEAKEEEEERLAFQRAKLLEFEKVQRFKQKNKATHQPPIQPQHLVQVAQTTQAPQVRRSTVVEPLGANNPELETASSDRSIAVEGTHPSLMNMDFAAAKQILKDRQADAENKDDTVLSKTQQEASASISPIGVPSNTEGIAMLPQSLGIAGPSAVCRSQGSTSSRVSALSTALKQVSLSSAQNANGCRQSSSWSPRRLKASPVTASASMTVSFNTMSGTSVSPPTALTSHTGMASQPFNSHADRHNIPFGSSSAPIVIANRKRGLGKTSISHGSNGSNNYDVPSQQASGEPRNTSRPLSGYSSRADSHRMGVSHPSLRGLGLRDDVFYADFDFPEPILELDDPEPSDSNRMEALSLEDSVNARKDSAIALCVQGPSSSRPAT